MQAHSARNKVPSASFERHRHGRVGGHVVNVEHWTQRQRCVGHFLWTVANPRACSHEMKGAHHASLPTIPWANTTRTFDLLRRICADYNMIISTGGGGLGCEGEERGAAHNASARPIIGQKTMFVSHATS